MATPNIVPRADSEGGIGTASKYWASAYIDLIYVGAGKIGRDSTDLIDFSTDNSIIFKVNNANRLRLDASQMYPVTSDGVSLGTGTNMFSDLFLASGAVINFDNGNLTLTHTSNTLTLADGDVFALGTSRDLQLFHESENSYISNNIGDLTIRNLADAKDIIFQSDDGTGGVETYFFLDGSANGTSPLTVFPDNSNLAFGSGPDTYLMHNGTDFLLDNHNSGDIILRNNVDDKDIVFQCDDGSGGVTTYFFLDGDNVMTQVHKNFRIMDSVQLQLGTSGDLQIYHDATDSFIKNSHGNLLFRNTKQNKDILFQGDDGQASDDTVALYFSLDGSSATHDGSATTALYTNWPDLSRISLGTSHDLQIYHDGSNSYIADGGTGDLKVMSNRFWIKSTTDEAMARFTADGASELFHNNISTFVTTATGVSVTGDAITTGSLGVGGAGGTKLQVSSSEPYVTLKNQTVENTSGGCESRIIFEDHGDNALGQIEVSHEGTSDDEKGAMIFSTNNDSGLQTALTISSGQEVGIGAAPSGGYALNMGGHISMQANDIYGADNCKILLGGSQDLEIYHSGTHSYIRDVGTGSLYLQTNGSAIYLQDTDGNAMAQFSDGGGSFLMHNGSLRLSTTATGVTVTGVAAAAVGGGFDGAETVTVSIGEVNQETITTIQIDLGTGGATDIVSSGTAGDVIGENDTAAAFITKYDSTKNGVLYKAELICLETPAGGDTDINLVLNASSLAEDAASETEGHVIIDGGAQTIGMRTESTASVITAAAGAHNDYIYLAHGGTTAGTYTAGKFLIRLYGALAAL